MLKRIATLVVLLALLSTSHCLAYSRIADIGCELMHQQMPTYYETGEYKVGELRNYKNKYYSFKGYFQGQECDVYLQASPDGYVELVKIVDMSGNNSRTLVTSYSMAMASMGLPSDEILWVFEQTINSWFVKTMSTMDDSAIGFFETTLSNGKQVILGYCSNKRGAILSISGK